jgi:hypothetical protein
MTTDKAFKRVVRARMARTGERYAAARPPVEAPRTTSRGRGRRHPVGYRMPAAALRQRRWPTSGESGRVSPDGRAVDRGHLGIGGGQAPAASSGSSSATAVLTSDSEQWQIPADRQDARSARHRARPARPAAKTRRSMHAGRRHARRRSSISSRSTGEARRAVRALVSSSSSSDDADTRTSFTVAGTIPVSPP